MHELHIEPMPPWLEWSNPKGSVYGRCSCGLRFIGANEADLREIHADHVKRNSSNEENNP